MCWIIQAQLCWIFPAHLLSQGGLLYIGRLFVLYRSPPCDKRCAGLFKHNCAGFFQHIFCHKVGSYTVVVKSIVLESAHPEDEILLKFNFQGQFWNPQDVQIPKLSLFLKIDKDLQE